MDRREEFDRIALSCITYLESFKECHNVNFQCGDGAASHESLIWEKRNAPYKLPKDIKNFYSLFNGIHLSWNVEFGGRVVQIGEIRINRMEAIKPIDIEGTFDTKQWNDVRAPDPNNCAAFQLDTHCESGEVVFLYRLEPKSVLSDAVDGIAAVDTATGEVGEVGEVESSYDEPEVWFIDQSSRWHFLAKTFTQYFRLLVIHLGVHGWHLAFTPEGLPTTTQHWMGIFCKERLIVDKHWRDRLLSNMK